MFSLIFIVFSTVLLTVFVSSVSLTVAVFEIRFDVLSFNFSPVTLTVNLTVAVPFTFPFFAGTLSVIPFSNSLSSTVFVPVESFIVAFALLAALVPAGSLSSIVTFPAKYPVFVAVIVYVIFCPGSTTPLTDVVFFTVISGFT